MRVDLPTPAGPWTSTTKGGGSSGALSITGTAQEHSHEVEARYPITFGTLLSQRTALEQACGMFWQPLPTYCSHRTLGCTV